MTLLTGMTAFLGHSNPPPKNEFVIPTEAQRGVEGPAVDSSSIANINRSATPTLCHPEAEAEDLQYCRPVLEVFFGEAVWVLRTEETALSLSKGPTAKRHPTPEGPHSVSPTSSERRRRGTPSPQPASLLCRVGHQQRLAFLLRLLIWISLNGSSLSPLTSDKRTRNPVVEYREEHGATHRSVAGHTRPPDPQGGLPRAHARLGYRRSVYSRYRKMRCRLGRGRYIPRSTGLSTRVGFPPIGELRKTTARQSSTPSRGRARSSWRPSWRIGIASQLRSRWCLSRSSHAQRTADASSLPVNPQGPL